MMYLGVGKSMANEVVQGVLGSVRLARGEWSKVGMEVYKEGREGVAGYVWGTDQKGWKRMVRGLVQGREEARWRRGMTKCR